MATLHNQPFARDAAMAEADATHEAKLLVQSVLTGQTRPYGTGYYTAAEWALAAQWAADLTDYSEIIDMMDEEAGFERFPGAVELRDARPYFGAVDAYRGAF